MNKLYTTFTILLMAFAAQAQASWFKHYTGEWNEYSTDAVMDANNNVYVTGNFTGNATLSDGETSVKAGFFIAKYSSSGSLIWMKKGKGKLYTTVSVSGVDCNGNNLILGANFSDSLYLGDFSVKSNSSGFGHSEIAVLKLDPATGSVTDHQLIGGGSSTAAGVADLRVNSSGEVFMTGEFTEDINFGNGQQLSCWSGLYGELFVVKLNAQLDAQWTYKPDSQLDTWGTNLRLDHNGDVIVSGIFKKGTNFGNGVILTKGTSATGTHNAFLMKLSASSGAMSWVELIQGDLEARHSIACDESGNVYVGVAFGSYLLSESDSVSAAGQNLQIGLSKFDNSGVRQWLKTIGQSGPDVTYALAMNNSGNLIAALDLNGSMTIDGISGDYTTSFYNSAAIGVFNPANGTLMSIQKYTDSGSNFAGVTNIAASSVDDSFLVSGFFVGTINLGTAGSMVNSATGYQDTYAIMFGGQPLGISEKTENHQPIYPNPATEKVFAEEEVTGMKLITTSGKLLIGIKGNSLDISGFPAGIYIVELECEGTISRQTLVKN